MDDHDRSMTDAELGETKSSPLNETNQHPNQTLSSMYSVKVTSSESSHANLSSLRTVKENADLKDYQANNIER